jgi:septal ring factor EnvC (AmiA/AmiB activator)
MLPQITLATNNAQSDVKTAIAKIYQQIRVVENNSNSILSGNDYLQNERKKVYLIQLLKFEKKKYLALETELNKLNALNDKIGQELERLNGQLSDVSKKKQQIQSYQRAKIKQAKVLKTQIALETKQLNNLKQTQAELNRLLKKLAHFEDRDRSNISRGGQTEHANLAGSDTSYEDSSPFLKRRLSCPVDGDVAVKFGDIRNGVPNHGLLFNANDSSVYAISNGIVVFSGKLPGFGQILVINNGDNYISIYGGVLPMVSKGQRVSGGQVIANSGKSDNQPMGGVYFELRHLGRPVNPTSLID